MFGPLLAFWLDYVTFMEQYCNQHVAQHEAEVAREVREAREIWHAFRHLRAWAPDDLP